MSKIFSSVACNLDNNILAACLPLFQESRIEAIEWSFDALYKIDKVPEWFLDLLKAFSDANRLVGHGIFFSLFSGRWSVDQAKWLEELRRTCELFNFDHITEHFGFMTGKDFHHGAPLNIPCSEATLAIGRDRLARIQDACRRPVGLENLAFSYSLDEVRRHGEFLEKLVSPVNGFIILDLHNLYCQISNFSISFEELIGLYPLDRVREIHISGGSWEESKITPERLVRRDTHDATVPDDVFSLLQDTIPKCPNLKFVVMEQLGNALDDPSSRQSFYDDFGRMERITEDWNSSRPADVGNSFLPEIFPHPGPIVEDATLHRQQLELSIILETAASCREAIERLSGSSLANTEWHIEKWEPYMIETAINIAGKWKKDQITI